MNETMKTILILTLIGIVAIIVIGASMAIIPRYRLWEKEMNGKAELAEAEWTKKIMIEEAKAELESAKLKAESEVERARGAAKSQEIITETLTEEYLRYLWIQHVEEGVNRQTIYIPTEAGLPILEAGRMN